MPTAAVHPPSTLGRVAEQPPVSPHHTHHHPWFLVAGAVALAVLVGLGIWALANRSTSTTQPQATPAATGIPWPEISSAGGVKGLQLQLRAAGYSLAVDSVLGPLTRSAAGNYLRPTSVTPLDPLLKQALAGTFITGIRDAAAWNARFGLNRATRFVERPLTGPGGQLDAFGNLTG
jgi:hypothetical protein